MLLQRSLNLSLNFLLFFLFVVWLECFPFTPSFRTLIHSSASSNLLLIPSTVFLISVILFLNSGAFYILYLSFEVFTDFIHSLSSSGNLYNHYLKLLDRLLSSASFLSFSQVLSCSFVWAYSSASLFRFTFCVCFYELGENLFFPVLKEWSCVGRSPV